MEASHIQLAKTTNHDTKKKVLTMKMSLSACTNEKEPPSRAHFDYNIPIESPPQCARTE